MSEPVTAGEIAAAFLERCGVEHAFGVISIHNMPILDAIAKRVPLGRIGQPYEEAAAIVWLLSDEASFVTGAILDVTGGM